MASSSECSTDFEVSSAADSRSVASAPEEQEYDDDEFDDYSDSFESDNDDVAKPDASIAATSSSSTGCCQLHNGTRVQVLWKEENEWFDGIIQSVEEGNEPRYYVLYDDGEQQWEGPASIRPFPALPTGIDIDQLTQLQQMLPLSALEALAIINKRAIVYRPDEGKWFNGVVGAAQASPAAVKIEYDDGDSRWEQEHMFNSILLLHATTETQETPLPYPEVVLQNAAPPSPPERVLYARPYRQVVSDHFQPVRIARPYHCAVEKHTKSVITPRPYSERRYLHQSLECSRCMAPHSFQVEKADSIVQTTLSSCLTEA